MPDDNKTSFLEGIGSNIINTAAGGALGILMQKQNDRRQIQQQQKLTNMQLAANMEMAKFNYGQQMQMWHDTNYGAQMGELKKAGLNPALIYGTGGAGATTAAAPGQGVTGGHAPTGGGEILGMMSQRMQLEMMKAQIENTQAQTEKTKAEIPNVSLTGQNIQASTASLTQGIENQKTQAALTKAQTEALATTVENVQTQTKLIEDQIMIMDNDAAISNATREDKINMIRAQAAGAILTNEATKMGIQLNQEQIKQISANIAQGWEALDIKAKEQRIQQAFLEKQIDMAGIDRIIRGVDVITNAIPAKKIFNTNIHNPKVWDDANR